MQASLLFDFKNSSSFESFISFLKDNIKINIGEEAFEEVFHELTFRSYDGKCLNLNVNTDKTKNIIFLHYQNRFEKILKKSFTKFFNEKLDSYQLLVPGNNISEYYLPETPIKKELFNISINLDKKYTFSAFLEEEENKLITRMAKHFAETITEKEENMIQFSRQLFIHGGIGNGKTHLAQAIGSYVALNSTVKVLYTTAEKFMFNFQTAAKTNTGVEFIKEFLNVKLLIIDDLHLVATKKKTIAEIQRVAYSILSEGGFVVFCSSAPANLLPLESENVRSFLSSCYSIKIKDPSEEFRFKVLKHKTALSKYKISDSTLRLLASKIQTNIRELEGAMGRMVLHSQILNSEMEEETVNLLTNDIFPQPYLRKVSIAEIQEKVAEKTGITVEEMTSPRRTKKIVMARQIAIHLASKLTALSYVEIGRNFGGRKHSTVIHSLKVVEKTSLSSRNFKEQIGALKYELESSNSNSSA